ncbi:MAG: hypothetical protein BGO41_08935 [Clostridiales bacterium 38-18]|nr:MAG: hypothetical protein BGO41_08935 [Clostridiales bacterium 38-18]
MYKRIATSRSWLFDVRRSFHQEPELSEAEFKTQEKIMTLLNEMNINNYPSAATGVCGVLLKEESSKTIGLRADIDALPIQEVLDLPFKSRIDNVMHACGHDAHTTILLGVAKFFSENTALQPCNLKFFFQPAEETIGGAMRMVSEGVMKSPDVDCVLGLHVMPYLPVGAVELREGKLNAASDLFEVKIIGKAAHGAYPTKGIDAIVVAASIINDIQTLISRYVSPLDQAVITIGRIHGGAKDNIICDEVVFSGGMRTTDEATRQLLKEKLQSLVMSVCSWSGAKAEIRFEEGYKALINDIGVTRHLKKVFQNELGEANVYEKELPSLGVEDFSYFLDVAKGAFYHLGCGLKDRLDGALHTHDFYLDEEALVLGTYLQVKAIIACASDL